MSVAPPRPAMTKARRARIFAAHDGICYLTGVKIGPEDEWDVEHVIPWALSHDDSDANLRPALVDPHAVKTKDDVKRIAKADEGENLVAGHGLTLARKGVVCECERRGKQTRDWFRAWVVNVTHVQTTSGPALTLCLTSEGETPIQ